MKSIMPFVFGGSLGAMILIVSPYNFMDWQYWASFLSVGIIGVIYANMPE